MISCCGLIFLLLFENSYSPSFESLECKDDPNTLNKFAGVCVSVGMFVLFIFTICWRNKFVNVVLIYPLLSPVFFVLSVFSRGRSCEMGT